MGTAGRRIGLDDAIIAAIMGPVALITALTAWAGLVRDFGTAGSLSSILGLPVTVPACWIARQLSKRMRRARMGLLCGDGMRNRNHVIFTIRLCKSLALGAEGPGAGSPAAVSAMREMARHIGESRAMHECPFTGKGKWPAERAHTAALSATAPRSCALADFPAIIGALRCLDTEILGIDDGSLVRRREPGADARDPDRE